MRVPVLPLGLAAVEVALPRATAPAAPRRAVDGRELRARSVDERRVRAAAGLTLAAGAVAFAESFYDQVSWPIRVTSAAFALDFALRVTLGLERSPVGAVAGLLVRHRAPEWVSVKPKRFAWTLGLLMAGAMAVITNIGIRGPIPRTVCLVCLTLMWLEAVLGLCLGCELYAWAVRRGRRGTDPDIEACAGGACDVPVRP